MSAMAVLGGRRPYHRRWCKCVVWAVGLCVLTVCVLLGGGQGPLDAHGEPWAAHGHARRLQSVMPNCTPAAIEQFPRDLFTPEQRKGGLIVLHILVAAYMFLALAIACDDYFVPSLEVICDILHLQTDVAGATFMAAGSSAPELATAVIAVFIAKDDIGLGTVVGSAVYNVTFVIGLCALCAGMVVPLSCWPLFRDCIFYAVSVIALVIILLDETVIWPEALGLILLYMVYIVIMYFNPRIEAWILKQYAIRSNKQLDEEITIYEKLPKDCISMTNISPTGSQDGLDGGAGASRNNNLKVVDSGEESEDTEIGEAETRLIDGSSKKATEEKFESPLNYPSGGCKRVLWVISLPLTLLMYVTVPDCRRRDCRRWFVMTFTMSLVWLSIFSYLIVWMITIIGHTFGIPDTVMGLTFIAFGVSIPDAISSLIVIREGLGDMGVSNAVGSNIFDILICLGIPWLLETTIHNPGSTIQVYSEGLFYSAVTLLSTVALLLIATHVNGWKLNKPYGAFLMAVYILFMALASLYELNVFGYFQPPECSSDF